MAKYIVQKVDESLCNGNCDKCPFYNIEAEYGEWVEPCQKGWIREINGRYNTDLCDIESMIKEF